MPAGQLPVGGAMIYSEALASQIMMLNRWEHDNSESRRIAEEFIQDEARFAEEAGVSSEGELKRPSPSPGTLQRNFAQIFRMADSYYVAQEITNVLLDGFDTLPDTPLGDIRPSSPYGWVIFEKPVICPMVSLNADQYIKAFAWGPLINGDDDASSALHICAFVSNNYRCVSIIIWPWEYGWNHPELKPTVEAHREPTNWLNKLIFSFFAFIRQECVTIQNQPAARPIRRHLPKTYTAEPIIKVIQLRRRSTATNADESVSVDYSCRWLVRGHWRNQFYPGSKSHRPRYIQPYVKGPDDKPLKPTKSSLFAVVR